MSEWQKYYTSNAWKGLNPLLVLPHLFCIACTFCLSYIFGLVCSLYRLYRILFKFLPKAESTDKAIQFFLLFRSCLFVTIMQILGSGCIYHSGVYLSVSLTLIGSCCNLSTQSWDTFNSLPACFESLAVIFTVEATNSRHWIHRNSIFLGLPQQCHPFSVANIP